MLVKLYDFTMNHKFLKITLLLQDHIAKLHEFNFDMNLKATNKILIFQSLPQSKRV